MGRRKHSKNRSVRRRSRSNSSGGSFNLEAINFDQFTGGEFAPQSSDMLQEWKSSAEGQAYKNVGKLNPGAEFKGLRMSLYTTPNCGMCAHFDTYVKPLLMSSIQARYNAALAKARGNVNEVTPFVEFETKIVFDETKRPRNAAGLVNLPAIFFDILDENGTAIQEEREYFVPKKDYSNQIDVIVPDALIVTNGILSAAAGFYLPRLQYPFIDAMFIGL